jgi:hypothetical protein
MEKRSCNTLKVNFEGPLRIGLSQSREWDNYAGWMDVYKANSASCHVPAFAFRLMLSVRRRMSPTAISTKTLGMMEDGRSLTWTTAYTAVSVRMYRGVQVCFICHYYRSLFADRGHNERVFRYSLTGKPTKTPSEVDILGGRNKKWRFDADYLVGIREDTCSMIQARRGLRADIKSIIEEIEV